jgi:hypothetical protein
MGMGGADSRTFPLTFLIHFLHENDIIQNDFLETAGLGKNRISNIYLSTTVLRVVHSNGSTPPSRRDGVLLYIHSRPSLSFLERVP